MASIYIPTVVKNLLGLYGELLYDYDLSIVERLERQAKVLWKAFQDRNEIACPEINNYHPDYLGKKPTVLFEAGIDFNAILKTIACEYGFKSWEEVKALGTEPLNVDFEKTIDILLSGDLEALKAQLAAKPDLISQTSQYAHKATLLHYIGSNGVEFYRQQVPKNLAKITQFLLEAGADKEAKMQVYGGGFTAYELLTSSAHPYASGVIDEMWGILEGEDFEEED